MLNQARQTMTVKDRVSLLRKPGTDDVDPPLLCKHTSFKLAGGRPRARASLHQQQYAN